jgi:hypothetical protein
MDEERTAARHWERVGLKGFSQLMKNQLKHVAFGPAPAPGLGTVDFTGDGSGPPHARDP